MQGNRRFVVILLMLQVTASCTPAVTNTTGFMDWWETVSTMESNDAAGAPSAADGTERWELVPTSGDERVEVLKDSIRFTSDVTVHGWVRFTRIDPKTEAAMSEELLQEFDCTKNMFRVLDMVLYRSNGKAIRPPKPRDNWEHIDEGSNGLFVQDRMCREMQSANSLNH